MALRTARCRVDYVVADCTNSHGAALPRSAQQTASCSPCRSRTRTSGTSPSRRWARCRRCRRGRRSGGSSTATTTCCRTSACGSSSSRTCGRSCSRRIRPCSRTRGRTCRSPSITPWTGGVGRSYEATGRFFCRFVFPFYHLVVVVFVFFFPAVVSPTP